MLFLLSFNRQWESSSHSHPYFHSCQSCTYTLLHISCFPILPINSKTILVVKTRFSIYADGTPFPYFLLFVQYWLLPIRHSALFLFGSLLYSQYLVQNQKRWRYVINICSVSTMCLLPTLMHGFDFITRPCKSWLRRAFNNKAALSFSDKWHVRTPIDLADKITLILVNVGLGNETNSIWVDI